MRTININKPAPFFGQFTKEQLLKVYQNSLNGLEYMRAKLIQSGKLKYRGYTLGQLDENIKRYQQIIKNL